MQPVLLNKPTEKLIDWVNSHLEHEITLEEYRKEMQLAENSGFIHFEDHKKNMNKWLETKLQ